MTLTIAETAIRRDSEGRYSLNDLHRAAGGEKRHQPANWMSQQWTQRLAEVLEENTGSPGIASARGREGGTYV